MDSDKTEDCFIVPLEMKDDTKIINTYLQELQERARVAQENFEREEKMRKELEVLNSKLLSEKTDLLRQLDGEKGSLTEYQERAIKLAAQKMDLESQLLVCINFFLSIA